MKVVFRTDASLWAGSGHVMRCLVLAQQLKKHGHETIFACLPQVGDLIALIKKRGFQVVVLTKVLKPCEPKFPSDYKAWLQRSVEEDALDFIARIVSADLVITDHYAIDYQWQSRVNEALSCHIVAIDDLVRKHCADIIIDQTLSRSRDEYQSDSKALTGCDYAILAPEFAKLREYAIERRPLVTEPRILISMGGVDQPNATTLVLNALLGHIDASFTILLNTKAPHYDEVKALCLSVDNVTHIDFVSNMADVMLDHDIAIGAPGSTSWERACLGLPSIVVPLADNQREVCKQLVQHQAVICVPVEHIASALLPAYQRLRAQWESYYQANLRLCDGLGLFRITAEISQLLSGIEHDFELVKARDEDIELVFEWQNHPATRRFALNSQPPSWDHHRRWMHDKLNAASNFFYLVRDTLTQALVAVLRLDRQKRGEYLVSIFVSPKCYGQGIGYAALKLLDTIHPTARIVATVLPENSASQRLFIKAEYNKVSPDQFVREPLE